MDLSCIILDEIIHGKGPALRFEWGRVVSAEEQKIRYWKHELNRAKLMSDEGLERKAHFILKRFEELGYV